MSNVWGYVASGSRRRDGRRPGHPPGRPPTGLAASIVLALAVLIGLCATGAPDALAAAAPPAKLQRVRLVDRSDAASVTLELSAAVPAQVVSHPTPARVVIDLPRTRRSAAIPHAGRTQLIRGLSAVRTAHGVRVVLTLRGPAAVSWQWLPAARARTARSAAARLRIELRADNRPDNAVVSVALPHAIRAVHAPVGQRVVLVAVDAGHGGVDPGATGPDGTHEKDVTLAIARALAARIDAAPGMHAMLTRDGDYFVPLRERMQRAREAHADLFVSIHADSTRDPQASGASVYILSDRGASSEAARELADEENAADLKGGISLATQAPDVRSVLMDLSQSAIMGQSGEAAKDVLDSLDDVGSLHKRAVQRAAFVVLKSPDVPSMLVETAYISNRSEERRLRSPAQQRRLADAIFAGIASYFRQNPPQGSLFARAHAVASSASS